MLQCQTHSNVLILKMVERDSLEVVDFRVILHNRELCMCVMCMCNKSKEIMKCALHNQQQATSHVLYLCIHEAEQKSLSLGLGQLKLFHGLYVAMELVLRRLYQPHPTWGR